MNLEKFITIFSAFLIGAISQSVIAGGVTKKHVLELSVKPSASEDQVIVRVEKDSGYIKPESDECEGSMGGDYTQFVFPLSNGGKILYSTLLSAQLTGKKVDIGGIGDCVNGWNYESIDEVRVHN